MKQKTNPAFEQALDELRDVLRRWQAGEFDNEPSQFNYEVPELPADADSFLSDDPEAEFAFPVRRRPVRLRLDADAKKRRRKTG